MKAILSAFLVGACLAGPACTTAPVQLTPADTAQEAGSIEHVLFQQAADWNTGDIDGFMRGYWQSPELRFASGGSVTRGYAQTLERYKTRYDSRAAMGTLSFTDLETVLLSDDAAVVHGRWKPERDRDLPTGLFTLVLRRFDGTWRIISDTTTSAD
jgi:hypothetical protein